jgi:uncharacterized delta-60 repeat protein
MFYKITVALVMCVALTSASAQSLQPISNLTVFGTPYISAITSTNDGGYLIAGWLDRINDIPTGHLARLGNSGQLDESLAKVSVDDHIISIAEQDDGRIIVGGWFHHLNGQEGSVFRLHADGTMDGTFTPLVLGMYDYVSLLKIQPDGKIMVTGSAPALRLNPDGTVDGTFTPEFLQTDFRRSVIDANGNAYAIKLKQLYRFDADGNATPGFPIDTNENGWLNTLAVLPSGQCVIGGDFDEVNGVDRANIAIINADGSVDNFATDGARPVNFIFETEAGFVVVRDREIESYPDGKVFNPMVTIEKIIQDNNGKFLITTMGPFMQRVNADLTADKSFACQPSQTQGISMLGIFPDEKILVGLNDFGWGIKSLGQKLVLINPDGTLDNNFAPALGNPIKIAIQEDGKALLLGQTQLIRIDETGAQDPTFANPSVNKIYSRTQLTISGDHIFVCGSFSELNGHATTGIARINMDGTLDQMFTSNLPEGSNPTSFSFQSDGKIVLGGYFTFPDQGCFVVRLDANGTVDPTFHKTGALANGISRMVVDSQDRIYIAGDFFNYDGTSISQIARLESNGELDPTFTPNIEFFPNTDVDGIILISDDEIVLSAPSWYQGRTIAVVDANGNELPREYTESVREPSSVQQLLFDRGRLYMAGSFTTSDPSNINILAYADISPFIRGALTNLTAAQSGSANVVLNWQNTITGATLMEVERSAGEGQTFEVIDEVALNATSYTDTAPVEGESNYRIKASTELMSVTSNNATVDITTNAETSIEEAFSIHPNPAHGAFYVNVRAQYVGGELSVYSTDGREVIKLPINAPSIAVDHGTNRPGLYLVSVRNGIISRTRRVVID